MSDADCVAALQVCGFMERQARFLVLVLEHSGVCLPRGSVNDLSHFQ